ncbi:type II toxin-antitoxin system VapB family antitoxin [Methylobacterium sp. Leaf108]|uniref:type II toxin-antitoxin system VapB family antitoxin n=1 Tax=Methylobacterium sp. Leaf108 TaxID=1736256 RepID=UPI0006F64B79|nr:type II toxin-antitoxin system VapB family antitoxin [Methylobacterium sp. Leaf108]KQP61670.1 hypothetical protein ASF39_03090 [Methylobacterium sp. Leaf108]
MPLTIEDDATADLVAQLAKATGTTKSEAVRQAERRALHPLPAPTGQLADKAFFDELSGE